MRQRYGRSWRLHAPDNPHGLIFSVRENNTQRVAALDARASVLGLRMGLGVAEARAMRPGVEIVEMAPQADRQLLEALADWCDRYTPLVAISGASDASAALIAADGLFLDITGCAHLFGGEQAMLDDILARVEAQGFNARAAIAATPGCAWAAARHAPGVIVETGAEAGFLKPLPLGALRLDSAICAGLESVGLRSVAALLGVARAPLARRFGQSVTLRLDQALGLIDEAVSPRLAVPALMAERHFFDPVSQLEEIEDLVGALSRQLKGDLERRGEGAQRLQLQLYRVDGDVARVSIAASRPLRDPLLIRKLFHEKLTAGAANFDAGFGFDLVRLAVLTAGPFEAMQGVLDETDATCSSDLALFADRIRARLGDAAVLSPQTVESHWPERAAPLVVAALQAPSARSSAASTANLGALAKDQETRELQRLDQIQGAFSHRPRPLRLLANAEPIDVALAEVPEGPPGRFRWRNVSYRVARAEGPERVEPEWWQAGPAGRGRDYFRVEDGDGRRYWLFREGRYGAPDNPPRWYVQGLFA